MNTNIHPPTSRGATRPASRAAHHIHTKQGSVAIDTCAPGRHSQRNRLIGHAHAWPHRSGTTKPSTLSQSRKVGRSEQHRAHHVGQAVLAAIAEDLLIRRLGQLARLAPKEGRPSPLRRAHLPGREAHESVRGLVRVAGHDAPVVHALRDQLFGLGLQRQPRLALLRQLHLDLAHARLDGRAVGVPLWLGHDTALELVVLVPNNFTLPSTVERLAVDHADRRGLFVVQ
mmetsp:Transcript_1934/g.5382  ORF Transcript_1934/g.5382 Transcript_1934/m.5382 type:complete len:228 (-) Transcript_1934:210-893(-)